MLLTMAKAGKENAIRKMNSARPAAVRRRVWDWYGGRQAVAAKA